MMRKIRTLCVAVTLLISCGCALLPTGSKKSVDQIYFIAPTIGTELAGEAGRCGVIQVATGQPASGQRGTNMAYTLEDFQLNYYSFARWSDAPARMLRDQMRHALLATGAFRGVLSAPVLARSDYQLELADVSVVQHFDTESSSSLHMSFETRLFDGERRQLIAARPMKTRVAAGSDAQSGVAAANQAADALLRESLDFVLARCGSDAL